LKTKGYFSFKPVGIIFDIQSINKCKSKRRVLIKSLLTSLCQREEIYPLFGKEGRGEIFKQEQPSDLRRCRIKDRTNSTFDLIMLVIGIFLTVGGLFILLLNLMRQ